MRLGPQSWVRSQAQYFGSFAPPLDSASRPTHLQPHKNGGQVREPPISNLENGYFRPIAALGDLGFCTTLLATPQRSSLLMVGFILALIAIPTACSAASAYVITHRF